MSAAMIRVEACPSTTLRWVLFDISAQAMDDQEFYEMEVAELNEFLREHDVGIDSGGGFVGQVREAIDKAWESGRRISLVLADSEHRDMNVVITKIEE